MFCVRSVLDSRKKIRVFNLGGGVFCVRSVLDSGKNFISGEGGVVLGIGWTWTLGRLSFMGRGVFWNQIPEQECSGEFGKNFWKPS